jgi:hypothetical protein
MFKAIPESILHPILVHLLKIKKNIGSQKGQTDKKIIKKTLDEWGFAISLP